MNIFETRHKKLEDHTKRLIQIGTISERKYALIHMFLSCRKYVDEFEIAETFTDGGNDLGVDAVYIERKGERPTVHLFQSKFHDSLRKAGNPCKTAPLRQFHNFFAHLIDRNTDISVIANPRLTQKIYEIRDLIDRDIPLFKIWLLSNCQRANQHEIDAFQQSFAQHDAAIEQFHLAEFIELCVDGKSHRVDRDFTARSEVIEYGDSDLRTFLGYISAIQLFHLLKDISDPYKIDYSLFDLNVRGYLGTESQINRTIFKSASSSENRYFAAMNNGLSAVATRCQISKGGRDFPKVVLRNLSIINGAQTCSTIFNAMKDYYPNFSQFENMSVLFRIFETDDIEQISKIAISANTQNRILPRDLKAHDEIQIRLQHDLEEFKIKYIRKREELTDISDDDAYWDRLDALLCGQLIMAFVLLEPARAKRESDSIFADNYENVFGNADAQKISVAYSWYKEIMTRRTEIEDEIRIRGSKRTQNTFVTYGTFHILALCSLLSEDREDCDKDIIISDAISHIASMLKEEGEPAHYTFFRDQKISKRLIDAIKQQRLI